MKKYCAFIIFLGLLMAGCGGEQVSDPGTTPALKSDDVESTKVKSVKPTENETDKKVGGQLPMLNQE